LGYFPFGVDDEVQKARALDMEIIEKCLVNEISTKKVKNIYKYTVQKIRITKNINGMVWSLFCAFE
jgi:hypothetical protein